MPDEEAVQRVLAEVDEASEQAMRSRRAVRNATALGHPAKRLTEAQISAKLSEARDVALEEGKKKSTREVRELAASHAAKKALGSTQLSGCPGDFCDYDTEKNIKAVDGVETITTEISSVFGVYGQW